MRFDTSMESLINIGRSESYADLNNPDFGIARSFMNSSSSLFSGSGEFFARVVTDKVSNLIDILTGAAVRGRHSFSGKATVEVDPLNANGVKPFGIGKLLTFNTVFSYHHKHCFFSLFLFLSWFFHLLGFLFCVV